MTYGEIIKQLRKEAGMTQKEFSEYFQIPKRTVEDWERNVRKMPEYLLRLITYKMKVEGLVSKDYAEKLDEDNAKACCQNGNLTI
jgi:DNA-binding transcriptional regulator YiaG